MLNTLLTSAASHVQPTKIMKKKAVNKERVKLNPLTTKVNALDQVPDSGPVLLIAVEGELGPFGSSNAIGEEWTVTRSDWKTISFLQSLDEVLEYTGDSLIFVHLRQLREVAVKELEKIFPTKDHRHSKWAEKQKLEQALNGLHPE
jgi:hypothetical protein